MSSRNIIIKLPVVALIISLFATSCSLFKDEPVILYKQASIHCSIQSDMSGEIVETTTESKYFDIDLNYTDESLSIDFKDIPNALILDTKAGDKIKLNIWAEHEHSSVNLCLFYLYEEQKIVELPLESEFEIPQNVSGVYPLVLDGNVSYDNLDPIEVKVSLFLNVN